MYFSAPNFLRRMFPELIWSFPIEERTVYITFDDGPNPEVTSWVLETLAKYNAKATFFCLGKNVEQYPETYLQILAEGHAVGNHSYSHISGWGTNVSQYIQDFDLAAEFIESNLIRPPYGRITPTQSRLLSERYKLVMWDILSRDYSSAIGPRACVRNVVKHIRPGAIIVFHDSLKAQRKLKYALPRVLQSLKEQNYLCNKIEL